MAVTTGLLQLLVLGTAILLPLSSSAALDDPTLAKRYTVNLDLPPKQRWSEIMKEYAEDFKKLLAEVQEIVPAALLNLIKEPGVKVETLIPYPYNEELMGIAEDIPGVNVGEVILGNYLYEITAFSKGEEGKVCTSIVAEARNGTIFHGRNLDYSLKGLLRNLTITVDFARGGKVVFTGTTFAGYVGLLTGQKPYKYTISLDERDKGKAWMNIFSATTAGLGAVASFRIRDTLDNDTLDFEGAIAVLANEPLIAPCYLIVGGAKSTEGVVITRDRMFSLDMQRINGESGAWFVLETNYDNWVPPPPDDDRRDPAIRAMKNMTQSNLGFRSMYDVISTPPILNDGTTYSVVMAAALPELYSTWVRK